MYSCSSRLSNAVAAEGLLQFAVWASFVFRVCGFVGFRIWGCSGLEVF